MADVTMPRLSDSMEEGTILKWLKSDGDEVAKGEELVEIETDKATMTYEADSDGVLEIVAGEGDTLPIGETIARLGDGSGKGSSAAEEDSAGDEQPKAEATSDEAGDEEAADAEESAEDGRDSDEGSTGGDESSEGEESAGGEEKAGDDESAPAQPAPAASGNGGDPATEATPAPATPDGDGADGERVKASPVARRMARELSVDLQGVSGSGPGGRIVKADVEAAAGDGGAPEAAPAEEAPTDEQAPSRERAPAPADGATDGATGRGKATVEELSRTQQLIARRMAESRATVPDFNLVMDIDMEAAVALRAELKGAAGEGQAVPSLNDLVVKASALALREFPRVNGSYKDGRFELHGRVNVGVAVAGEDALVVPTVFDADTKSLGQVARDTRALAQRVREKQITPPELSGGTFTVSNLGMFGIDRFTAVINPPQAAILAVGSVAPRVVVREEKMLARATMTATLACDHRILYGADAAQFLGRVRDLLEQPLALAL